MQQQTEQGYSALDAPITGSSDTREPFPLGTWIFRFKDLHRGFTSSFQDDDRPAQERCKVIFEVVAPIRAKRYAPTADIPKPQQPSAFVGTEFHAWANYYERPSARATLHGWISAIIGETLTPGMDVRLGEYVGALVEVTIGLSDTNKPVIIAMTAYEDEPVDDAPEPEPVAPTPGRRHATKSGEMPF